MSPILSCVYLDELLIGLSKIRKQESVAILAVTLLEHWRMLMTFYSSHQVLQLLSICKMLSICNDYACEYPMSFNAQKSKCLVVLPRSRRSLAPLLCHCDFRE